MKVIQAAILLLVGALGALLFVKVKGGPDAQATVAPVKVAEQTAVQQPVVPAPAPEPAPTPAAAPPEAKVEPPRKVLRPVRKASPVPVARAVERAPAELMPAPAESAPPVATPPPPVAPLPVEPVVKREPEPVAPPPPPPPPPLRKVTIAQGTLIPVRLIETVSSDKSRLGDRFSATLDQELVVDGFVIAEKGARVEGRVAETRAAGRVKGVSDISLELTSLTTSDGQRVEINTDIFTKQGQQSKGSDAAKIGGAAAIGAAIGAIAGGGKGAAIGAGVGGAAGTGGVLSTRGKPAVINSETKISFRVNNPVTITERRHGR